MTTRDDVSNLIQRLHEAFNSRQFDRADDLFTPDFFSHPLGRRGFEAGKDAWRALTERYPAVQVAAVQILVDGDKAAVHSTVEGVTGPDGAVQPLLFEIFRLDGDRFAEMWGASAEFPPAAGPKDLL